MAAAARPEDFHSRFASSLSSLVNRCRCAIGHLQGDCPLLVVSTQLRLAHLAFRLSLLCLLIFLSLVDDLVKDWQNQQNEQR